MSLVGTAQHMFSALCLNQNYTVKEATERLEEMYQKKPELLGSEFSNYTRTNKFSSIHELIFNFSLVQNRCNIQDAEAIQLLFQALGTNFIEFWSWMKKEQKKKKKEKKMKKQWIKIENEHSIIMWSRVRISNNFLNIIIWPIGNMLNITEFLPTQIRLYYPNTAELNTNTFKLLDRFIVNGTLNIIRTLKGITVYGRVRNEDFTELHQYQRENFQGFAEYSYGHKLTTIRFNP
ncbi:hypothetical protein ACTA71_010342 [Dictyostelium dimigraforme]